MKNSIGKLGYVRERVKLRFMSKNYEFLKVFYWEKSFNLQIQY